MKYRKFGKLGWDVSEISLGVFQLSATAEDSATIDVETRKAAIHCAIDNGVNYINLGYPFFFENPADKCGYIREALSDGYRKKVKLTVNIPALLVNSREGMDRYLNDQLRWFGCDSFDFCQIEGITRSTWQKLKDINLRSWLDEVSRSGKILHFGFAFHDDSHYLNQIFDYFDQWVFVQFEYSLMDYKHHPGVGGLKIASDRALGIIASEGLKGGRLTVNIPPSVQAIWDEAATKRTPDEWTIRWLLNHSALSTALFEFLNPVQVLTYLAYADSVEPGMLDIYEQMQANKVRDAYNAARSIPCTACRCCMPCPLGIDAPRIVELYNDALVYGNRQLPQFLYHLEGHQRILCQGCGVCEQACPRHYPLMEIQKKSAEHFTNNCMVV